jgi:1-acyl-sn-glycerol-3-phosphate acyltransferase
MGSKFASSCDPLFSFRLFVRSSTVEILNHLDIGLLLVSQPPESQPTPAELKRGRVIEAPPRGKLFMLLLPYTSWFITNMSATLFFVYFFVLNRTTVTGRKNMDHSRNTLLLANHQSYIDSWVIGVSAFLPHSWWRPWILPWNPAAIENLFHTSAWAWLAEQWRCIPIKEGRRDIGALKRILNVLRTGTVVMFPEGGRSRDGSVGKGVAGPGFIALKTNPTVIPIAIHGMEEVYPIGKFAPGFGKRIKVAIGEPIDYDDLKARGRNKETAQELVDRVMDRVRELHEDLRQED